jgi:GNAT superfamily N-acetyltransferase
MSEEQETELAEVAREVLGSRADIYFELFEKFASAHPHEESHYYLSLLGTAPEHRGHGFGMALLRHDLALIDEQGSAAYLESSNPANDDRCASEGFRKVGEFQAPEDGPTVSTMWRSAR